MLENLGEFQVLGLLGKGGMGSVYRGYQPSLDREVALKVLSEHLTQNETYIARFQREARSAASLIHPNVIQIYTIGREQNIYYFAMEFVRGNDLAQHLAKGRHFSIKETLDIVRGVSAALGCAAEVGLIHRDIKPSNIMLDDRGLVKVTDFGLAKSMSSSLTEMGVVVGTANYMSPEQGQGKALDSRTDIYSLGAVFYEMVTGRPPFIADQATAVLYMHIYEKPIPPRKLKPDLPQPVEDIILQMLAKNPDDRPRSASEVEARLKALTLDLERPAISMPPQPAEAKAEKAAHPGFTPDTLVSASPQSSAGEAGSALIADSIASVRRFLATTFESRNFKVYEAGTAGEALALLEKSPPKIAVLDMHLPGTEAMVQGGDGLALAEAAAKKSSACRLMIIGQPKDREKVVEASRRNPNISAFLAKPVNLNEMGMRIDELVEAIKSPALPANSPEAKARDNGRLVLVYTGSPYSRILFRQVIGSAGHKAGCAENIDDAKRVLTEDRPDLFIMVMSQGDQAGEELLAFLASKSWPMPILFIINEHDSFMRERLNGMRLGTILSKPIVPDQLLGEIERLLATSTQIPVPAECSATFERLVTQQRLNDHAFTIFDFARLASQIAPPALRQQYEERIQRDSARDVCALVGGLLVQMGKENSEMAMRYIKHAYRNGDFETRSLCLAMLKQILSPEAEAAVLVMLVTDEDHRMRMRVLHRMGELARPEFAEIATRFLNDDVWKVRNAASECLEMMGGPLVLEALVVFYARVGQPPPDRLRRLLLNCRGQKELQILERLARSGDAQVKAFVATVFGEANTKQAGATLFDMLRDRDPQVRAAAALSLGKAANEKSLASLAGMLTDEDAQVQAAVITALCNFDLEAGAAAFLHALGARQRRIPDSAVRLFHTLNRSPRDLERALVEIDKQADETRKYLSLLVSHLFPDQAALAKTVQDLNGSDPAVRARAARLVFEAARKRQTTQKREA